MLASFGKYMHRYGVVPEDKLGYFTNNSSTISLIKSLVNQGYKPKAYIDSRDDANIENEIKDFIKKNNISFYSGHEVEGCEGNKSIEKVFIRQGNSKIKSRDILYKSMPLALCFRRV